MTLFEPYDPESRRSAQAQFQVRAACEGDVDAIARIARERNGGSLRDHRRRAARGLVEGEHERLYVAEMRSGVAAYGRVQFLTDAEVAGSIPDGWYLGGLVVAPAHRRCGLGTALTRRRVRWVAERADVVRYFVNLRNEASIALHARLGFREIRRDLAIPGVRFSGGTGVLYALDLPGSGYPPPDSAGVGGGSGIP